MSNWIDDEDWATVVANVPIPSADLVVRYEGGVLLGRRSNEPAKGEWFVPGGRIQKNERMVDAVHRVADEELDTDVTVWESLGAYDHLYDTSDVDGVESKHYVAHGFAVEPESDPLAGSSDGQHDELRLFHERPEDCHEYVAAYLDAADLL